MIKCVGRSISSNLVDDACDRLLSHYFGGCFIEAILSAQSHFLRWWVFTNSIHTNRVPGVSPKRGLAIMLTPCLMAPWARIERAAYPLGDGFPDGNPSVTP